MANLDKDTDVFIVDFLAKENFCWNPLKHFTHAGCCWWSCAQDQDIGIRLVFKI